MALQQQILVDSTESIWTYPPIQGAVGAVTSPEVKVQTPASPFPSAFEAASLDSVDTTLSAAASAGAESVTLTSAASVTAGVSYLIAPGDGDIDPVVVTVRRVSGSTVYLQEPLPVAVSSGDVFTGWRISKALTSTQTDTEGHSIAIWRASVNGVTYEWVRSFYVVRYKWVPTLNAERLTRYWPEVHRLFVPTDDDLSEAIDAAWENVLVPRLLAKGLRYERIRSVEELEPAHAAALIFHLKRSDPRFSEEDRQAAKVAMGEEIELALGSRTVWYDEAEDLGSPAEDPDQVLRARQVRLGR